ncbi:hypothetical protein V5799_013905 [Amblyomma americanum]|uniref:Uncharacterized protein n=1 Tax=Amblyomma americanum TaxID=6943 RepID=A0AAQ4E4K9_AMBAM
MGDIVKCPLHIQECEADDVAGVTCILKAGHDICYGTSSTTVPPEPRLLFGQEACGPSDPLQPPQGHGLHELPWGRGPGLRRFTTVCTVSYLHIGLVMPPGDNCNYIFYDSLYSRPEDTFMGTFTNNYLKPFFDAARQSTTVRFGFSVHAPAVDGFTNEIRSVDGKKHYKDHWQQNVYGWGFLNIHELIVKNSPQVVKSALTALKVWCLNL